MTWHLYHQNWHCWISDWRICLHCVRHEYWVLTRNENTCTSSYIVHWNIICRMLAISIHILSISGEYRMYNCTYTNHYEFSTLYLAIECALCIAMYVPHIKIVVFVWCDFHMNIIGFFIAAPVPAAVAFSGSSKQRTDRCLFRLCHSNST